MIRKFGYRCGGFGLLVLLTGLGMNAWVSTYNDEPGQYRLQYEAAVNRASPHNAIIIGSSHATHGIRPSLLDTDGLSFYNYAFLGSGVEFYLQWWDEVFLPHHPTPDYCIITVDNFFVDGGAWRQLEQDAAYLPWSTFSELFFSRGKVDRVNLALNRIPLFKYRSRMPAALHFQQGDPDMGMDEFDKGFVPFNFGFNPGAYLRDPSRRDVPIGKFEREKFIALLDRVAATGAEIALVMPPEYDLTLPEYASLRSFVDSLATARNLPFYDFNHELADPELLKQENFADVVHMNGRGSKRFSQRLREVLFGGREPH